MSFAAGVKRSVSLQMGTIRKCDVWRGRFLRPRAFSFGLGSKKITPSLTHTHTHIHTMKHNLIYASLKIMAFSLGLPPFVANRDVRDVTVDGVYWEWVREWALNKNVHSYTHTHTT